MTMNKGVTAALALSLGAVGCDGYLTGPGKTENPNEAVTATAVQLLIGVQAGQFTRAEGQIARLASMYVQQLSGVNNQQRDWGSYYLTTEQSTDAHFSGIYTNGGLVDLRKIQKIARETGNEQLEGVAKIWEAFVIGMAASVWGDLPYREAIAGVKAPELDPQRQVYEDVQKLLDEGIRLMAGAGPGPGHADVVYGGDRGRWTRLAWTLKARFHLHTAERLGAPAYQAALVAAQQGINEAPTTVDQAVHGQAAGDFRSLHGGTLETANLWAQFLETRQDMVAGNALLAVLGARPGDPRLPAYFRPNAAGAFRGADQFGNVSAPASEIAAARRGYTFRQPIATWSENQLILAEAKLALGDAEGARAHLNGVRRSLGLADRPAPVTLEQVAEEKYIVTFQNVEAWNDYRRLCYPRLVPAGRPQAREIPTRLPYGLSERQNNPRVPLPTQQVPRNWNDPAPCP